MSQSRLTPRLTPIVKTAAGAATKGTPKAPPPAVLKKAPPKIPASSAQPQYSTSGGATSAAGENLSGNTKTSQISLPGAAVGVYLGLTLSDHLDKRRVRKNNEKYEAEKKARLNKVARDGLNDFQKDLNDLDFKADSLEGDLAEYCELLSAYVSGKHAVNSLPKDSVKGGSWSLTYDFAILNHNSKMLLENKEISSYESMSNKRSALVERFLPLEKKVKEIELMFYVISSVSYEDGMSKHAFNSLNEMAEKDLERLNKAKSEGESSASKNKEEIKNLEKQFFLKMDVLLLASNSKHFVQYTSSWLKKVFAEHKAEYKGEIPVSFSARAIEYCLISSANCEKFDNELAKYAAPDFQIPDTSNFDKWNMFAEYLIAKAIKKDPLHPMLNYLSGVQKQSRAESKFLEAHLLNNKKMSYRISLPVKTQAAFESKIAKLESEARKLSNEGVDRFSRAVDRYQKNPEFLNARAKAYLRNGAYEHAMLDINRSLEIDEGNPVSNVIKADILRCEGKYEEARAQIVSIRALSMNLDPDYIGYDEEDVNHLTEMYYNDTLARVILDNLKHSPMLGGEFKKDLTRAEYFTNHSVFHAKRSGIAIGAGLKADLKSLETEKYLNDVKAAAKQGKLPNEDAKPPKPKADVMSDELPGFLKSADINLKGAPKGEPKPVIRKPNGIPASVFLSTDPRRRRGSNDSGEGHSRR